ncbi:MAG: hypothetical protein PHP11_02605 [Erysipelotrichaceae bacterium]|nr:hypothetical protein [Erysipelotrichaceae bacterium]MDD3923974.1 hypothetical protein [Erysipelotrichaceae bacterium]MDD4642815.1 hypothetical protein [Erysipelotrichaceae bacterium]
MIENFSDLLSIASLIVIILAIVGILAKDYFKIRERALIKEEIDYYKER